MKGKEFRYIDVDISQRDALTGIFDKWKIECVGQSGDDIYIRDGSWVSYDDCRGHGSGLETIIRTATTEEFGVYKAFRILFSQVTFKD